LANIAVALSAALAQRKRTGSPGGPVSRVIARGDGWSVADVVCTSGPQDRPFEEQHSYYSIAIVVAGTFQYRSTGGREVMTPGSLLLGNEGHCYECGHEHGEGDRCVSFSYDAEYFERLAADAGVRGRRPAFRVSRLPPLQALSPLVARAGLGTVSAHLDRRGGPSDRRGGPSDRRGGPSDRRGGPSGPPEHVPWSELAIGLASRSLELAAAVRPEHTRAPVNAEASVVRAVREIDRHPDEDYALERLARLADLSPYHFLRTFERVVGVTPHQYVLRTRLRHAATRLIAEPGKIVDLALDCGFGDVSNFNRAFRTEFRMSPRALRSAISPRGARRAG
jgi:AraC-like DNA-binding protein